MKLLKVFVLSLCCISPAFSFAQEQPVAPPYQNQHINSQSAPKDFETLKERIYVGGSASAWFGSTTYLSLSPLVGFKLTKKFSVGVGGTYNYYKETYGAYKYTSSIYGSNVFARYMITDQFFAQAQWDRLSVPDYTSPFVNDRAWVHNLLIGGGYRQLFTDRASFVAMIFYNANQTPLSPYTNPIVQIGFNINL